MEKRLTTQGAKGRKSFTVTLPIDWIKREKLDKKRVVDMSIAADKVVISPWTEEQDRVSLDGDLYKDSLIKVLPGLYRAGINEIGFSFSDNCQLEEATCLIEQRMIGYEIIEQKKNYIVIKDITRESQEDFKVILRRVFLLVIELSESDDKTQSRMLEKNVNKLTNYCQRILIKQGHVEFAKTPIYYILVDKLEKLSDEFCWLNHSMQDTKRIPQKIDKVRKLIREMYELYYRFDAVRFNKANHESYQLRKEAKLLKQIDLSEMHYFNILRIINSMLMDTFLLSGSNKIKE